MTKSTAGSPDRFDPTLRLALAALDATGVVVFGLDPSVRPLALAGRGPAVSEQVLEALVEPTTEGRILTVPLAATHSLLRRALQSESPVASLLSVPIHDTQAVVSAGLCVWCDEPRAWTDDDTALIEAAAAHISDARSAREALTRSQEHLLHAQKMEAVGRLAGGMAHDFNNLLTAIMGFGELLLEGIGGDDPVRRDAEEIVRSASRGRDLTNQLLSFSRKKATRPVVVDLNDVVSSGLRLLERLLRADVTLETSLDEASGAVRVDRTELEQILVNLTLNARDALPPEGGNIRIETRPVRLMRTLDAEPEAIPAGRWETLTVRDNGAGIDGALRAKIFEPFFTTKAAGQGTGLGLAMVYGIVKRFGGFVSVDSRPGKGTEFGVYLPPAHEAGEQSEPTEVTTRPIGFETVLLVEDQAQIRALLARQLERSGFRVFQATNGYEALDLWREHGAGIDLIVTDVVMPVMDGPSLVTRVRTETPGLPAVFISGYPGAADPSEREIPLPEGRFLRKPFPASELIQAIRDSLDTGVAGD